MHVNFSNTFMHSVPTEIAASVEDLVEILVQAFTPPSTLPFSFRCDHATPEVPVCPACVAIRQTESTLAEAYEAAGLPEFPRSMLEILSLRALRQQYPPMSSRWVAHVLHQPYGEVGTRLRALATLGTIERPCRSYYRYRPAA
jgi:hypothetical protein